MNQRVVRRPTLGQGRPSTLPGSAVSPTTASRFQTSHYAQGVPIRMRNSSGATVPKGSVVVLDTGTTEDISFTTSTTAGDENIFGVTLEEITDDTEGLVQVAGLVPQVRAAAGTTRYQYLRQSTVAGVAEGASAPTSGTFAQALTSRDADGYVQALLGRYPITTPQAGTYDAVISAAVVNSFWDSFEGLQAIVGDNDRYTAFVVNAGPTTPQFAADATDGRTYTEIGTGVANLDDAAGILLGGAGGGTFTPRAAEDWGFKAVVSEDTASSGGTVDAYLGFVESVGGTGQRDGIYFRSTNSGNWFLVCRDAGTETAVDLSTALNSTKHVLEFRITGGGTSVQAYVDNIATGSAITTNIPTNLLTMAALVHVRVATAATAEIINLYGWGAQSGSV